MSKELTNFFVLIGVLFSFVILVSVLIVIFNFIQQKMDEVATSER